MKLFVTVVAALLAAANTFANGPTDAPEHTDYVDYILNSDWEEKLTAEDARRLEEHMRLTGGTLWSKPMMTLDVLGVDYPPMARIPIAAFHEQISSLNEGRGEAIAEGMMEIFNIQLVSPFHRIKWPPQALLHVQLSQPSHTTIVRVPMALREDNAYYVRSASSAMSRFIEAMSDLAPTPRPRLRFLKFEGFVFNNETVENMQPLGVPVTYHVRYGDMRIETDYQWAGRPASIPVNSGKEFLK